MDLVPDRTDRLILAALQKNARITNKDLAAGAGVAPSTCLERVRRLEEAGVIGGYHAELDPAALGIGLQAMIAVRLARHSRDVFERFRAHVLGLPEVAVVYHLAGASDLLIQVLVRNPDHLRDLVLTAFTSRPEVAHLETSLIFEQVRSPVWPDFAGPHR